MFKREKGVTLVILVVIIIVLLIIAGISLSIGKDTIVKANLESVKTNMLLIQAKAKEHVENANFKIGKITDVATITSIKSQELIGTAIEFPSEITTQGNNEEAYSLSAENMQTMGLTNLQEKASDYIVIYNVIDVSVDVIYKPGFTYEGNTYYRLSEMEANINS